MRIACSNTCLNHVILKTNLLSDTLIFRSWCIVSKLKWHRTKLSMVKLLKKQVNDNIRDLYKSIPRNRSRISLIFQATTATLPIGRWRTTHRTVVLWDTTVPTPPSTASSTGVPRARITPTLSWRERTSAHPVMQANTVPGSARRPSQVCVCVHVCVCVLEMTSFNHRF